MAGKVRAGDHRNDGDSLAREATVNEPHALPNPMTSGLRIIYVDIDDDLPEVLDRLEESSDPAVIVLPDGAHVIRGMVSARLLARRANAAGIRVATVAADRTVIAQLEGAGIQCAATVGEARALFVDAAPSVPLGLALPFPQPGPDTSDPEVASTARDHDEFETEDVNSASTRVDASRAGNVDGLSQANDRALARPLATDRHNPTRRFGGIRKWSVVATIVATLIAVLLGVWILLFPSASISITYGSHLFERTYVISIGSSSANQVPLRHTHIVQSLTTTVLGTGATLVADGYASGTITFANPLSGVVIVPAGTVVDAAGGSRYATDAAVSVPGAVHSFAGTSNGQANVRIHALRAGLAANAGAGSVSGIEGRLAGALLVTNYQPLAGGTIRTVYSLTPADIKAPITRLHTSLHASAVAMLDRQYARSPVRWLTKEQAMPLLVRKFTSNGRPAAHITVSLRADMAYVHMSDITAAAINLQRRDLADKNQVVADGSVTLHVSSYNAQKTLALLVTVTARTSPSIDVANMRALLTGMGIGDAKRLLDGSAKNGGWSYTLTVRPDWAARLPIAESLIAISVRKAR